MNQIVADYVIISTIGITEEGSALFHTWERLEISNMYAENSLVKYIEYPL